MEALAAAGGVIAVVSLTGQVVQGCVYLRNVFDNARSAPQEIKLLATELKIIEGIVVTMTDMDQHADVLDFCNEKVSKLRKVVEK
jgi:Na+-transporting NADH:ubiquinone oxidoreductase subunit NqrA